MTTIDYYVILGVEPNATLETIREAHRKFARKWHPDLNKSPEAGVKFREGQEAYGVLIDAQKRTAYDSSRANGGRPTSQHQTKTNRTKPVIQIKKSTLIRTAKYAKIGAGVLLGYVTMHSYAAQLADGLLEKIGIELTIENPADTIEAKIEDMFSEVQEIFTTNKNRMRQGLYNGLMFEIKKRYDETEAMFLQYGKGTEVARYAKEALNPETVTARLEAYGKNAPRGEVVQKIVENERAMEAYLGTILSKEEKKAHYSDMAMLPIEKGWLTDQEYGKLITEAAAKASPETVATVASPYLTTPEARKTVLNAVVGRMTQEERVQFVQSLTVSLPQDQYDAEVLQLTARVSTDGYAQIKKQKGLNK